MNKLLIICKLFSLLVDGNYTIKNQLMKAFEKIPCWVFLKSLTWAGPLLKLIDVIGC